MLLVGANTGEAPATGQPGDTRGYDARTGARVWEFHSVPRPGEPGHETWEGDSWKDRSGVNNWGFSLTVDNERGIVYTTFGRPNTIDSCINNAIMSTGVECLCQDQRVALISCQTDAGAHWRC